MPKQTCREYSDSLAKVLRGEGPRVSYFVMDAELRRERVLKLAREIGAGFALWSDDEINQVIGGTYSTLLVVNTFDSIGPTVDANEWCEAIRGGVAKMREFQKLAPRILDIINQS